MTTEIDEQNIEYVQYLDENEYEQNEEIVTANEENLGEIEYIEAQQVPDNIEYDVDGMPQLEGYTIFEHNGRHYMIPAELSQGGHTILLQDTQEAITLVEEQQEDYAISKDDEISEEAAEQIDNSELTYYLQANDSTSSNSDYIIYNNDKTDDSDIHQSLADTTSSETIIVEEEDEDEGQQYTVITGDGNDDSSGRVLGKRYAVLRDGRLHIEGEDVEEGEVIGADELEGKLQVLEESLTYQEDNVNADSMEITGKNLITGQTISLTGFLEKLKKKSDIVSLKREPADNNCYPPNVKRQRRTFYNQTKTERCGSRLGLDFPKPNYVLMPPVNKKVLVGKTPQGKNIVGRILQVWKKVDNTKNRPIRKKPQKPIKTNKEVDSLNKILQLQKPEGPKNVLLKKKYVSKDFLDQNIVKTLSGLMELETIQKNLAQKNLIIKHILKKSLQGKILPAKEITYYYGHMEKNDTVDCFNEVKTTWTFVSDYRDNLEDKSIDLKETSDSQQVDVSPDGKVTFGSLTEPELTDAVCTENDFDARNKRNIEFTETVPVNLIVIEDEFGKKRTKVTIPQLGGSPKCPICHKIFKSDSHLKRHQSQHSSSNNFTCEHCGKSFYDIYTLFKHSKQHVNSDSGDGNEGVSNGAGTPRGVAGSLGGREYVCYVCDKSFTSPGTLKRHIMVHDHSLRPLQCMVCLQRFTDESSLKKHMVLHTGLKPFECEICHKCFVHAGDLNFHRKIHDPVKRYQCKICGKEFYRRSNMLRHADIHKGQNGNENKTAYRCETCGCQYNFISSLTRHIVSEHMNKDPPEKGGLFYEGTTDNPEDGDQEIEKPIQDYDCLIADDVIENSPDVEEDAT